MINKLKIIAFSRIKKPRVEQWVLARRQECEKCPLNTKNIEKLPFKVRAVKFISDTYSLLMGKRDEDTLGNCTACDICSIYYKSAEEVEDCEKGKWKSIYIPNK